MWCNMRSKPTTTDLNYRFIAMQDFLSFDMFLKPPNALTLYTCRL